MKVLSIKNPYAYLICAGIKKIENRTWYTNYRGKLLIHASGTNKVSPSAGPLLTPELHEIYHEIEYKNGINIPKKELKHVKIDENGKLINNKSKEMQLGEYIDKNGWMKCQAIIGEVELVDIIDNSNDPFAIKGQYHWVLENPVTFKTPIEYIKGKLNLWDYNIEEVPDGFQMS